MILADRMQELSNYDKLVYVYDNRVNCSKRSINDLNN